MFEISNTYHLECVELLRGPCEEINFKSIHYHDYFFNIANKVYRS